MTHCCFAGCDLMLCGCCFNHGWHEEDCEDNPIQKLIEVVEEAA